MRQEHFPGYRGSVRADQRSCEFRYQEGGITLDNSVWPGLLVSGLVSPKNSSSENLFQTFAVIETMEVTLEGRLPATW